LQQNASKIYALLLRITLRRDVADDLLHDLFIKLAGRIAHVDDPAAYMARTAINLAMDWRRRDRRPPSDASPQEPTAPPQAEQVLENAEEIERILQAAQSLSKLEQQVFVLRFVQQESHEQVAQVVQRTPHQVRGLCDAVVKHIRRQLSAKQVTDERSR
jgi:RNA polymerase sigma factor (sigma-70 family)